MAEHQICTQEASVKQMLKSLDEMSKDLRELSKNFNELKGEFKDMHAAHNQELIHLQQIGAERFKTHGESIRRLQDKWERLNPELIQRNIQILTESMVKLEAGISANSARNEKQDSRVFDFIVSIVKWGAAIVGTVAATWLATKKL